MGALRFALAFSATLIACGGPAGGGGADNAFGERITARAPTPFVENGRVVTLEVIIFKPFGPGPFPTVMFHHGSTGNGDDPSLFPVTYTNEGIARFFVERGFLIAFPQRRGRGASDGMYDEGFTPDRSRYSCVMAPSLAGFEHAMADVDAAHLYLIDRSDVDGVRLLSAGVSRGGVLALTHAAERQGAFRGAINFVGGWLAEGCADGPALNRLLFQRAGRFPAATIWMYGEGDSFYSVAHSRGNFAAFTGALGRGTFHAYTRAAGLNGHYIINDPLLWTADLDAFVREIGR
jgi:dienelactone hydrolase